MLTIGGPTVEPPGMMSVQAWVERAGRTATSALPSAAPGAKVTLPPKEKEDHKGADLFDWAPVGYMILETSGVILRVNRAWLKSLGYDEGEAIGRHVDAFLLPEGTRFADLLGRHQATRYVEEAPLRLRRKDGGVMDVLLNADFTAGHVRCIYLDVTAQRKLEQEREELVKGLQRALAEIRTLRGFLPICASCKKIRDDKGAWQPVEVFIRDRTEVEFTHGICPECAVALYPELARRGPAP
jgi:PAS domain S-box-containing protein